MSLKVVRLTTIRSIHILLYRIQKQINYYYYNGGEGIKSSGAIFRKVME